MNFFAKLVFYLIIVFSFSDPLPLGAREIFNGTEEAKVHEKSSQLKNTVLSYKFSSTKQDDLFELLEPTGVYGIGTSYLPITISEPDINITDGTLEPRKVMSQIWYPVDKSQVGKRADYMDAITATYLYLELGISSIPSDFYKRIKAHAIIDAPIFDGAGTFPVLIFSPGLGVYCSAYQTIIEDIVSHGYVVVGINHPGISGITVFPDGHFVIAESYENEDENQEDYLSEKFKVVVNDIKNVVEQLAIINSSSSDHHLKGKLDMSNIGLYGHSFGGAAAVDVCGQIEGCKGAMDIDGTLHGNNYLNPMKFPVFLMLAEEHTPDLDPSLASSWFNMSSGGYAVFLKGAQHLTFSDAGIFFKNLFPFALSESAFELGTIDPERAIQITRQYTLAFFDSVLKKDQDDRVTNTANLYPESTLFTQKSYIPYLKNAYVEQGSGEFQTPILHVHGTAYEMGFQHGYLLADKVTETFSRVITNVVYLLDMLTNPQTSQKELSVEELYARYSFMKSRALAIFEKPVKEQAPELYEELQGIADGLKVRGKNIDIEDLIFVSSLADLLSNELFMASFLDSGILPTKEWSINQCSGFAAWGDATLDGKLYHGANNDFDTFGILDQNTYAVVADPENGYPFIGIFWPGFFPLSGMNEKGVSVNEMTVASVDSDLISNSQIPHSMHMRKVIQYAKSAQEAEQIIRKTGGTIGWGILVCDAAQKTAYDIECSASKVVKVTPWDDPVTPLVNEATGLMVTNQYMAVPGFRGYEGENLAAYQMLYDGVDIFSWDYGKFGLNWLSIVAESESFERWSRLWELFDESYGTIDAKSVIRFMSDDKKGSNGGVISEAWHIYTLFDGKSVPHIKGSDSPVISQGYAALYSAVFAPESGEKGVVWLASGAAPAQKGPFYPIDLAEHLKNLEKR